MLKLRAALRLPPSPRWVIPQRPRAALMATLPGIPGNLVDEPSLSEERDLPPHHGSPVSGSSAGSIFAESLEERMNADPDLASWNAAQPSPLGLAYPLPGPAPKSTERLKLQNLRHYGLYVKSSRNNTITTVTNPEGGQLKTYSGGICGFKGNRRASFEAGYQCAIKAIEYVEALKEKEPSLRVNLMLNGFGQGRDAMNKALHSSEGVVVQNMVTRVTDITPKKIGGTRAKKKRRS